MATGTLLPNVKPQYLDSNGNPYAGAKLFTYTAGTTTKVTTYSDSGLTTANANPLTLDSAGRVPSGAIYITPGQSIKVVLAPSTDTDPPASPIWTQDNVGAVPPSTVDVEVSAVAGENLTALKAVYLSDGSGGLTAGRWYRTDAALPYASSLAGIVGMTTADIVTGATGAVRIGGRVTGLSGLTPGADYYASTTVGGLTATAPTWLRFVGRADSTTTLVVAPNPPVLTSADPSVCDGRLTLTSGTSVTTSDVTAATTVYFTPHNGSFVSLYTGATWRSYRFTELSLSIAGYAANLPHDIYLYDNAGTLTLEGLAWTNTTTRATAIVRQDGAWVKSGATTRRWLGTICTTGSVGQTEDSLAKRFVSNASNRVRRPMRVLEATDSWSYATAAWRQANGAAANQLAYVCGIAEDAVQATAIGAATVNPGVESCYVGIGLDATNALAAGALSGVLFSNAADPGSAVARYSGIPSAGYHFLAWLEYGSGTGTNTWFGDNGGAIIQTGIVGDVQG